MGTVRWPVAIAALLACGAGWLDVATASASAEPVRGQQAPGSSAQVAPDAARPGARVTMTGGARLLVRVGPSLAGPGSWRFILERQSGTTWKRVRGYRTVGTEDEVSLPVPAGTYRVVVPAQNGRAATTSAPRTYRPTPDVSISGDGAVEVQVGPVRAWRVAIERKTDAGWKRAGSARVRGRKPIVFRVDAGTYRVRTQAIGRFPAHTGAPFAFRPRAPAGPVPYRFVAGAFAGSPVSAKRTAAASTRAASSSCASVMTSSSAGVDVATGALNLIPVVGGALGVAFSSVFSASANSSEQACLSAEFATINAQLAFQEGQIATIQNQLREAKGEILAAFYDVESQDAYAAQTAFTNDVNQVTQCDNGLFELFMTDAGLWSSCQTPSSVSVQDAATSSAFGTVASSVTASEQNTFALLLEEVSGNQVAVADCLGTALPPAPGTPGPDCYEHVVPYTSADSLLLAEALTAQLNIAQGVNTNAGQNVVPLFDQYHEGLIGYYQQSVIVLQAGFTMEYLTNQLNYYNAGRNAAIPQLGGVPGTYYSYQALRSALGSRPSATQQAQYYNLAQRALANVYIARMNRLYQDTIGFVVTDIPVGGQSWPADGTINADIGYASNVGRWVTIGSGAPLGASPITMLPTVADSGASWVNDAALYQYYGLRDAGACDANLVTWNRRNGTAVQVKTRNGTTVWVPTAFPSQAELQGGVYDAQCPPFLTTSTGGAVAASATPDPCATAASGSCWDGDTLYPYHAAAASLPDLGSAVRSNLLLCDAGDPALTWFQVGAANAGNAAGLVAGDWALTCGSWAAVGTSGWKKFPQSTPPTAWTDSTSFACPAGSSTSYCLAGATGLWGPFSHWQNVCYSNGNCDYVVSYTFNSYYVDSGYYVPQTQGAAWVPASTATPLNIGGPKATTTVTVASPSCSKAGATGASLSGCTISFSGVNSSYQTQDNPDGSYYTWYQAGAGLANVGVTLGRNTATGASSGGFVLPLTVGAAWGKQTTFGSQTYCKGNCTLLEVWLSSGTSIVDVGYQAPPSSVDPTTSIWSRAGYVTVADGSCWNVSVGRTANNVGTITTTQQADGSACAT